MSVRLRKWLDSKGRKKTKLYVDVTYNYPDGTTTRFRRPAPVQTRRAAERYEREVIAHLASKKTAEEEVNKKKEELLFRKFAKTFLKDYAATNNKKSTVQSKKMILRLHLTPFFGAKKLGQIKARDVERYKALKYEDGKGLSKKTINEHLSVLRKLLSVAIEWEYLDHLPLIKRMKAAKPEFDFLDFDEADRLIDATDAEAEWRPLVTLALKTGMRSGELFGLRWQDVDLVAKKAHVRQNYVLGEVCDPKSGKSRTIDLCDDALAALKEQRPSAFRGELVFSTKRGKHLTKNMVRRPLARACRRAGLREVGMRVLRHTFASHLVMQGVPLKVVQELLGHSDIRTTMTYAHLAPSVLRDAVKLLDRKSRTARGTSEAHGVTKECN